MNQLDKYIVLLIEVQSASNLEIVCQKMTSSIISYYNENPFGQKKNIFSRMGQKKWNNSWQRSLCSLLSKSTRSPADKMIQLTRYIYKLTQQANSDSSPFSITDVMKEGNKEEKRHCNFPQNMNSFTFRLEHYSSQHRFY